MFAPALLLSYCPAVGGRAIAIDEAAEGEGRSGDGPVVEGLLLVTRIGALTTMELYVERGRDETGAPRRVSLRRQRLLEPERFGPVRVIAGIATEIAKAEAAVERDGRRIVGIPSAAAAFR
jgi:hypothetical protein